MEQVSISHMGNAHSDWLRGLKFYKEEIKLLKNRLTEIAGKNPHPDVMKEVEHYENQFEIQAENIHRLTHDIKSDIKTAGREQDLGDRFVTEEKTVNELRQSFNQFASGWN